MSTTGALSPDVDTGDLRFFCRGKGVTIPRPGRFEIMPDYRILPGVCPVALAQGNRGDGRRKLAAAT